jgi:3-phenylpropionate/trans-cinnamate dioxygenase ferredoxin subunit
MRHVVCPVGELPPGERRIVDIGRRSIGVFHVGDRFYAVRNRCPHQGGPLCVGHILGDAVAHVPGAAAVSENPLRIACPWHGWEYDLATGQSFMGPGDPGVKSYGVALEPGEALVAEVEDRQVKLVPGPYTAETFEVKVEDDYVVLEV